LVKTRPFSVVTELWQSFINNSFPKGLSATDVECHVNCPVNHCVTVKILY